MDVEGAYDAVAEPYAEKLADELECKPFDRDLLDGLAKRVAGQGPVADVGCGPGHVGRYLFDRGVDVVGIDVSGEMLRVACERNPGMRFDRADVRSLPFLDDELAGAVAFYSLIHLDADGLTTALAELHRVIRPAGVLCVAVHGGTGTVHLDEWFGKRVSVDARFFSLAGLADAINGAGFVVESAVARPPYPEEGQTERIYVTAVSS